MLDISEDARNTVAAIQKDITEDKYGRQKPSSRTRVRKAKHEADIQPGNRFRGALQNHTIELIVTDSLVHVVSKILHLAILRNFSTGDSSTYSRRTDTHR